MLDNLMKMIATSISLLVLMSILALQIKVTIGLISILTAVHKMNLSQTNGWNLMILK